MNTMLSTTLSAATMAGNTNRISVRSESSSPLYPYSDNPQAKMPSTTMGTMAWPARKASPRSRAQTSRLHTASAATTGISARMYKRENDSMARGASSRPPDFHDATMSG